MDAAETRPELVVVGAINVDLIARVSRAPGRGETVADGELTRQPGGKGANQAVAAARLGARVRMIGAVGTDALGDYLRDAISTAGVDVSGIQTVDGDTGTALIVVDDDGVERDRHVRQGESAHPSGQGPVHPVDGRRAARVADAVVERAIAQTTGFVAISAVRLIVHRAVPTHRPACQRAEYELLPALQNAPLVAVTLGADGARLLRHGTVVASASSRPAEVRNSVGAGDAFSAALTLGLLRGDEPAIALARACEVGAAAVEDDRSQPALSALDRYPVGAYERR